MSNPKSDQAFSEGTLCLFREAWIQHLVIALSSMLGEPVELRDDSETPPLAPNQWFHQAFPPLDGSLSLGLDRESVIHIGAGLLKAAGLQDETSHRAIQTFAEMLSHASAGLASQFSARLKSAVHPEALGQSDEPPASDGKVFPLRLVTADGSFPVSAVVTGQDLVRLFDPSPGSRTPCVTAGSPLGDPLAVSNRNLDLLLDVELPISVSFGKAELPLKDVIRLTTGSIVELNRSVSEPVDIIVNNCIIARGEVVVVEGNFGVRIKQIVSKQERLRSVS
jgi:flagellar motor switch protein FliN